MATVVCPHCHVALDAPDPVPVGKPLQCLSCATIFRIPEVDVIPLAPPPATAGWEIPVAPLLEPKPQSTRRGPQFVVRPETEAEVAKPVRAPRRDAPPLPEPEPEPDRPRKRRRRRYEAPPPESSTAGKVAAVAALLLAAGLVVGLVFLMVPSDKKEVSASPASAAHSTGAEASGAEAAPAPPGFDPPPAFDGTPPRGESKSEPEPFEYQPRRREAEEKPPETPPAEESPVQLPLPGRPDRPGGLQFRQNGPPPVAEQYQGPNMPLPNRPSRAPIEDVSPFAPGGGLVLPGPGPQTQGPGPQPGTAPQQGNGLQLPNGAQSRAGSAALATWLQDPEAAKAEAKHDEKDLLLLFTGSDWHPASIALAGDVFSRPTFDLAMRRWFVPVLVDFPNGAAVLAVKNPRRNVRLREQYGVEDLPAAVLADSDGRPYARLGYKPGDAQTYLAQLTQLQPVRTRRDELLAAAERAPEADRLPAAKKALQFLEEQGVYVYYRQLLTGWYELARQADPKNEQGDLELFFEADWFAGLAALATKSRATLTRHAGLLDEWKKTSSFKDAERAARLHTAAARLMAAVGNEALARRYLKEAKAHSAGKP